MDHEGEDLDPDTFDCPFCKAQAPTIEGRDVARGKYERTRKCNGCGKTFETFEIAVTSVDEMGCWETEERWIGDPKSLQ